MPCPCRHQALPFPPCPALPKRKESPALLPCPFVYCQALPFCALLICPALPLQSSGKPCPCPFLCPALVLVPFPFAKPLCALPCPWQNCQAFWPGIFPRGRPEFSPSFSNPSIAISQISLAQPPPGRAFVDASACPTGCEDLGRGIEDNVYRVSRFLKKKKL